MKDILNLNLDKLESKPYVSKDFFRVSILDTVYESLYLHAEENKEIEICGVLIGDVYKDEDGPYLEITDFIRGEYAQSKEGQVMYTFETWAYINEIKESKFKEKKIIGWYHSHPGYGVFLSQQDTFIQENFFNQNWQVAFVIDPKSNEDGFFVWSNDKLTRISSFSIVGHSSIKIGRYKYIDKKNSEKDQSKIIHEELGGNDNYKRSNILLYFILFIAIGILLFNIYSNYLEKASFQLEKNILQQQLRDNTQIQQQTLLNVIFKNFNKNQAIIKKEFDSLRFSDYYKYDIRFVIYNLNLIPDSMHILSQLDSVVSRDGFDFIVFETADNNLIVRGKVYFNKDRNAIINILNNWENEETVDYNGLIVNNVYRVKENDNLKSISKSIYGSEDYSEKIYELNKDKIINRDSLVVNTEFQLPE